MLQSREARAQRIGCLSMRYLCCGTSRGMVRRFRCTCASPHCPRATQRWRGRRHGRWCLRNPTHVRSRTQYDGQRENRSISHQRWLHRAVRKEELRGRTGDDVDTGLAHRRHTLRLSTKHLAQNHRSKNAESLQASGWLLLLTKPERGVNCGYLAS